MAEVRSVLAPLSRIVNPLTREGDRALPPCTGLAIRGLSRLITRRKLARVCVPITSSCVWYSVFGFGMGMGLGDSRVIYSKKSFAKERTVRQTFTVRTSRLFVIAPVFSFA